MKAQVDVIVGDYATSSYNQQFYEISLAVTAPNGHLTDDLSRDRDDSSSLYADEGNEGGKRVSSEVAFHSSVDDLTREPHFVTSVNVPSTRCSVDEAHCSELVVSCFTERVCVIPQPPGPYKSCASFCNYEIDPPRCKQVIDFIPALSPAEFRDSLILLSDSTRRRYRTSVDCAPSVRPIRYRDTCYVTPRRLQRTFVTYVDYNVDKMREWYHSAIQVVPRTFCNNFIHGFEFADDSGEDDDNERRLSDEDEDDSCSEFKDALDTTISPLNCSSSAVQVTAPTVRYNGLNDEVNERDW